MRTGALLAVVCGGLLAGALVWSRRLVTDVPAPPGDTAPLPPAPPSLPLQPLQPQANDRPPPPPPSEAVPERAPPAGTQRTSQPPAATEATPAAPQAAPVAEDEVPVVRPEETFRGDSPELQYAERIIKERVPRVERLRSAIEVLERCLEVDPGNQRCQRDLAAARARLQAAEAPPDQRPAPIIDDRRPQLRRPWVAPLPTE